MSTEENVREERLLIRKYLDFCKNVSEYRNCVSREYFKINYATFQNKMRSSRWRPSELVRMADAMNISDEDLGKIVRQEAAHENLNEI